MIELNQAMFRRLVLFDLLVLAATFAIELYESLSPRWVAYSDEFYAMSSKYFRSFKDLNIVGLVIVIAVASVLFVWFIASILGLLWFQRWARFGMWASTVGLFIFMFLVPGLDVSYASPLSDALLFTDSALTGAILLLAYAKGYGEVWFSGVTLTDSE